MLNITAESMGSRYSHHTDPEYCLEQNCHYAYALSVIDSDNVRVYGAGLYSFFNNYIDACLIYRSGASDTLSFLGITTLGSVYMIYNTVYWYKTGGT